MNAKIGINSLQIKEFGGVIDACEVEIIELGLDRVNFLEEQNEEELLSKAAYLASSFGNKFTIHAPHIDSKIEEIRIDFSTLRTHRENIPLQALYKSENFAA